MIQTCPSCGTSLIEQPGARMLGQTAERYEDCRRICPRCEIALSNARTPTFIRRDWRDGLWRRRTAVRLARIIDLSLNEVTREKKRLRLAHERSEDLLTWNVFSWLEDRRLLRRFLSMIGAGAEDDEPRIFYWGANDRYGLGVNLRCVLSEIFQERSTGLSEPDLILLGASTLILIEAKLGSPNDRRPGRGVDSYVGPVPQWFVSTNVAQEAGYYELTRNWAVGAHLAMTLDKRLFLVNLVRHGEEQEIAAKFGATITAKGTFMRVTWEDVVSHVEPALAAHLQGETLHFRPAFAKFGAS